MTVDELVTQAATLVGPRYDEPHRHYHNRAHVTAVLTAVAMLTEPADGSAVRVALDDGELAAVRLAAWYHDAVYDPRADDNEQRSAQLARRQLTDAGADPAVVAEVVRLVQLTRDHSANGDDPAGSVLCDADLAVLAGDGAAYDRYVRAVRKEYAFVPDDRFRTGRAAVLRRLIEHPSIYATGPGRERWEADARANLSRELSALE
jgi:predicted metal-dependent HD superfamily phosphohydrolase